MADGDAIAFVFESSGRQLFANLVPLDPAAFTDTNTQWVNIGLVGYWKGHPKGPIEFTVEKFDVMVANFEKRATHLNYDYDHQSYDRSVPGPKISAGAIKKLERRGDLLWAQVAFTKRAADMIRSGEYRSCSMVVDDKSRDRETDVFIGAELLSVALTNDPFIDGLHPHQLTRAAATMAEDTKDPKPEDDKTKLADPPPPPPKDKEPAAPDGRALLTALADVTGVSADGCLGILMDKLQALAKLVLDNAGDGTVADGGKPMSAAADRVTQIQLRHTSSQVTALSATVAKLQQELADERARDAATATASAAQIIASRVTTMVNEGYIPDGDQARADAIHLFTHAPDQAARLYANKLVPLGDLQGGNGDPPRNSTSTVTLDGLTAGEKRVVKMLTRAGAKDPLKTIGEYRAAGKAL